MIGHGPKGSFQSPGTPKTMLFPPSTTVRNDAAIKKYLSEIFLRIMKKLQREISLIW